MKFQFDADGFLTQRRYLLEAGIRKTHRKIFGRATEINHDCHELLFGVGIHNRDARQLLVSTLFARALEHYQSAILLLGVGLVGPAKVTIRAALETVFTIRAVAYHKEAIRAFINDDLLQRRKLIQKAKQHNHTNLRALSESLTEKMIQELEDEIRSSAAKPLTTEELSKLAGMHGTYTTAYALLSKAAHTHVRELESYLTLDDSGEIQSINYAPSTDEIPHLLLTVARAILLATDALRRTFGVDFDAKANEHLRFIEAQMKTSGKGSVG